MENIYIKTAADARKCIGQKLYWDDTSARYVFLREGKLLDVSGRFLAIDHESNYLIRSSLKNLRNFADGGDWEKNNKASA